MDFIGVYPEQLAASGYTHLIFSFAYIDPSSYQIAPMDTDQESLWGRLTALKETNPGLKVW